MVTNETHQRFKDADFYNPNLDIIILGLGGIGSYVSNCLCRQGYEMYLYDFDTIETINLGSQLFTTNDVGKNKAEVAKELANKFGNHNVVSMGKFEEDSPVGNIMFSCFDNMKYRKIAFERWLAYQTSKTKEYREANPAEVNCFIDGRMSAEQWQVYFVKSTADAKRYALTLFDDSEVPDAPCSYKATAQTGFGIGAYMSTVFLNHVANKKLGLPVRETAFETKWFASSLTFEKNV